MNRKYSQSSKSKESVSITLARKIYTSSKALKPTSRPSSGIPTGKQYASLTPVGNKVKSTQINRPKFVSCFQDQPKRKEKADKNTILPFMKNIDFQSTAEDLMEKINEKLIKQNSTRNKMRSFLFARVRKNSDQPKACSKHESSQEYLHESQYQVQHQQDPNQQVPIPTINYDGQYCSKETSNLGLPPQQRKVFQCKIIKSAKIPFALPRKTSVQKCKKMECLLAQTQNISEIRIATPHDFITPESKYLIEF